MSGEVHVCAPSKSGNRPRWRRVNTTTRRARNCNTTHRSTRCSLGGKRRKVQTASAMLCHSRSTTPRAREGTKTCCVAKHLVLPRFYDKALVFGLFCGPGDGGDGVLRAGNGRTSGKFPFDIFFPFCVTYLLCINYSFSSLSSSLSRAVGPLARKQRHKTPPRRAIRVSWSVVEAKSRSRATGGTRLR